ncbi:MAG: histidine--tRNA ligase [Gemmataceae bacterium]
MSKLIETKPPSGFRDFPPAAMLLKERVLNTARCVYRSYGYSPIDTPAAESLDVLLGKGGGENDKLVYRVQGAKSETAEMGLRFDLTVPFARFAARHIPDLGVPFKRYALGPVWRGERPGHGRYREFWQCDFDTIGTTSNASDIEVALVINDLFTALGFDRFEVRVNNRLVLSGLLESLGIADKSGPVLRALDKLPKIGREKVVEEMGREAAVTAEQANRVLMLAEAGGSNAEVLADVEKQFGASPKVADGIARLRELLAVAEATGVPAGRIRVDLSIARGLDYYTGTIYETFLGGEYTDDKGQSQRLEGFGSVCSGGRYDNLASLYTKQVLPGVGASLGVDRLLAAMEAMKHPWVAAGMAAAPVLVLRFDGVPTGGYERVASQLRDAGIGAEVYPDAKKLGVQFQYAEKRGFRLALIAGPEEFAKGMWKVKELAKREEQTVLAGELVSRVMAMLG